MKRIAIFLASMLFVFSCACNEGGKPKVNIDNPEIEVDTADVAEVEPEGFRIAAVDLGLSVKWANANVGANAPEEYGDYYAWGETATKDKYDWSTYKYSKGGPAELTKYNIDKEFGTVDKKMVLLAEDDAATAILGEKWRIPTSGEWEELLGKCEWTRESVNDVAGFRVTGSNGNSIFIPAAGSRDSKRTSHVGEDGFYWSATILDAEPSAAMSMHFGSRGSAGMYMYHYRFYGQSVRAVSE